MRARRARTHWPPRPDRSAHDTQGHCCMTTALTARLPRAQVSPSSAGGSAPGVASAPLPKASNRSIQLPASTGEAGPQAQPWRLPGASTVAGGVLAQPGVGPRGAPSAGRAPGAGSRSTGPPRAAISPPRGCGTSHLLGGHHPHTHMSRACCDTCACPMQGTKTPGGRSRGP